MRAGVPLERSEELFRLLVDGVEDYAIIALDPEGRVANWNAGARRISGYAAEEILGRSYAVFYPAEEVERGLPGQWLRRALEVGRVEQEGWRVRKDGARFWANVVLTPLRDEAGRLVGYAKVTRDLTERRRTEEELRRASVHVRLLQRVAVAANEASTLEEAARTTIGEVCGSTGWPVGHLFVRDSADELVPSGVWHLGDPARFEAFRERTDATRFTLGMGMVGRVAESGAPLWIEDVTLDPRFVRVQTDAESWVRGCFAFPVRVGAEVSAVLEFFSDEAMAPDAPLLETMGHVGTQLGRVIERQRAEEAMRVTSAKFSGIISLSADAIISTDEAQRIVLFNRGAEQIFGYTAEEAIGRPLSVLIPEEYRARHAEDVRGFGASGTHARQMAERGKVWGQRKSGEVFPAEASISKIDVGGQRIYSVVLRDATERVETERRLARQAEELARSNAELEQFAYVASHDLQEPLRMVASYTQLLARRYGERLDADAHEFIGYAVDGVTRMQALINDLLALSRVGTRGAEFEEVALEAVLSRALTYLGPAVREGGATVTHDPLPVVRGDASQLLQVLQNLIGNAIKFRAAESPCVHVGAVREEGRWVVSVRDNGIGIDPEYADRIFLLFQRLHGRGEYPGTGIGLAICKKIVERHGGRIWVESREGEGSTFRFTLPDPAA